MPILSNNDALLQSFEDSGNIQNFHIVHVPVNMENHKNPTEITLLFTRIHGYIKKNCNHTVYSFTTSSIWPNPNKPSTKKIILIAFEDRNDASNFQHWFNNFIEEFKQNPPDELFPSKKAFEELLQKGDPFSIASTIEYQLEKFDNDGITLTSQVLEIWNWIQENCKKRVWRWDKKFRFEGEDDAALFKLTWK